MKMLRMRDIVAFVVVIAMVVAITPIVAFPAGVLASDNGSITANFTLGSAAPVINTVTVTESDNSTAATSLTPQQEFVVKVNITDDNQLDDLNTCNVTLFYDVDSDNSTADIPGDNATHAATIHLTVDNVSPTWTITDNSTTWEVVTSGCSQPTLSGITGTFCFRFKIGKIATEATDWDIYVAVADDSANTDTHYEADNWDMNWYGEVANLTASLNWGTVLAGTGFSDNTNEVSSISATYISNGAYDEQIAAASTAWGGSSTLVASDTLNSNQFAIRVDDQATYDNGTCLLVDLYSSGWATIDDTGVQTVEAGDTVTTNTFWLKLGSPFIDDTYSGTIYVKIADGS